MADMEFLVYFLKFQQAREARAGMAPMSLVNVGSLPLLVGIPRLAQTLGAAPAPVITRLPGLPVRD